MRWRPMNPSPCQPSGGAPKAAAPAAWVRASARPNDSAASGVGRTGSSRSSTILRRVHGLHADDGGPVGGRGEPAEAGGLDREVVRGRAGGGVLDVRLRHGGAGDRSDVQPAADDRDVGVVRVGVAGRFERHVHDRVRGQVERRRDGEAGRVAATSSPWRTMSRAWVSLIQTSMVPSTRDRRPAAAPTRRACAARPRRPRWWPCRWRRASPAARSAWWWCRRRRSSAPDRLLRA